MPSRRSSVQPPIVVPSRGSKLIGGSIRTELTRAEVTTFILDGFFPQGAADDLPRRERAGGVNPAGDPLFEALRGLRRMITLGHDADAVSVAFTPMQPGPDECGEPMALPLDTSGGKNNIK